MTPQIDLDEDFKMQGSGACCGKPQGCTNFSDQCRLKKHPLKRATLGDRTVRCPAMCVRPEDNVHMQCVLLNLHQGLCDPQPLAKVAR